MSSITRPRGPLQARTYWVRRLAVLSVLLLFAVGLTRLVVGFGAEEQPPAQQAKQAAAQPTGQAAEAAKEAAKEAKRAKKKARKKRKKQQQATVAPGPIIGPTLPPAPVLAEPEGTCTASDITVTPQVPSPIGGSDIVINLGLRTETSPACTWALSAESLTVKIRSGSDDIWSTQQCPAVIGPQELVLRNNATTQVAVAWSARRSDETCSATTDWALPGWYHVESAALGGQPTDLQFQLEAPSAPVVTKTVTPTPTPTPTEAAKKNKKKNRDR